MGAINENKHTINVKVFLTELGLVYDNPNSEVTENVISLFLSQPILRQYAELKDLAKSSLSHVYSEKQVLEQLCTNNNIPLSDEQKETVDSIRTALLNFIHVDNTEDYIADETYQNLSNTELTPQQLKDNLQGAATKGNQVLVLLKFLELNGIATKLIKYNSLMNVSTKSFKSFFEILQLKEDLLDMINSGDKYYDGITQLLGKVYDASTYGNYIKENPETINDFVKIDDWFILPETTEAHILTHLISSAELIMGNDFPYNKPFISKILERIKIELNPSNLMGDKGLQTKSLIIADLKKFFERLNTVRGEYSTGLFKQDTPIPSILYKLFKNTDTNSSLGVYLQELKSRGIKNELLDTFIPDINTTDSTSLIKVNINNETQLSTLNKANILAEMLNNTTTIIDNNNTPILWDGEEVTNQQLAQHIILYSFMSDNANGAIGFANLIPQDVLNTPGLTAYNQVMRMINEDFFQNESYTLESDNPINAMLIDTFITQFVQHHPDLMQVTTFDIKNLTDRPIDTMLKGDKKNNIPEPKTFEAAKKLIGSKNDVATLEYILQFEQKLSADNFENDFGELDEDKLNKRFYVYKAPYDNRFGKYIIFKRTNGLDIDSANTEILNRISNVSAFGISQYNPNNLGPVDSINTVTQFEGVTPEPEKSVITPIQYKVETIQGFLRQINNNSPDGRISLDEFIDKTKNIFDPIFLDTIKLFQKFGNKIYIVPTGDTNYRQTDYTSLVQNEIGQNAKYSAVLRSLEGPEETIGLLGLNFDKVGNLPLEKLQRIILEELIHARLNPTLHYYFATETQDKGDRLTSRLKPQYTQQNTPVEITQLQWAYNQAVPAIKNLIKQFPERTEMYEYYLTFDEFFQALFTDKVFAKQLNEEMAKSSDRWKKTDFITHIIEKLKQFFTKLFGDEFTEPVKAMVFDVIEQAYGLQPGELTTSYFNKTNEMNELIFSEQSLLELLDETTKHNDTISDAIEVSNEIPQKITQEPLELEDLTLKQAKQHVLNEFDEHPELFQDVKRVDIEEADKTQLSEIIKKYCKPGE